MLEQALEYFKSDKTEYARILPDAHKALKQLKRLIARKYKLLAMKHKNRNPGKYLEALRLIVQHAPRTPEAQKYSETVHAALNHITSTLNSANRALNTESEYKALELLEPVLEKYKGMKPAKALIFRASSLSQRTGRKEKAMKFSKDIIDNYWNGQQDDSGIIPYCAAYIARKRKIT